MRTLLPFLLLVGLVKASPVFVQEESVLARLPWDDEYEQAEHPPHHPPHHHPEHPPAPPSDESKSIYEILKADERFSYVTKAIKFTETEDFFGNSDASLTFFAPPNEAFPGHHDEDELHEFTTGHVPLSYIMSQVDELEKDGDDKDKPDKEKRRKILKAIATSILAYHTIPHEISSVKLAENTTVATNLTLPFGLNGGQPLRIKTQNGGFRPTLRLNLFTVVTGPDVAASNGVIHVIGFPLFPPPPAFGELFWGAQAFSTFTSAIQRVYLLDELDIRYIPGKDKDDHGKFEGAKAVTVFAPTNKAFKELPGKLKLFLFSPLGGRVLRKILQYHIVPNFILHSDYAYNATSSSVATVHPPHPEPIFEIKKKVPTLFSNHTLDIHITKFNFTLPFPGPRPTPPRIVTNLEVNGNKVPLADFPALNGVVHVINKVLLPAPPHDKQPHPHPHPRMPCMDAPVAERTWDNWEEWLLDWAAATD